jgi:hypothetical protein
MKVLPTALKHGYTPNELEDVINCCPQRIKYKSNFGECYVYWGTDKNGNMIEVFMSDENELVFHANKLSKTIENRIGKGV